MTPHEVIKESIEETEHIIPKIVFEGESVAVDLIKETSLSLLLSVKDMVESKKKKLIETNGWIDGQEREYSWNIALNCIQSLLDEEINKVKEI